jgi:hypothetical protein
MQQVLYMSIQFEEKEENFIERAMDAMAKVYDEYDVPTIKKYFYKHYARIPGKLLPPFFFSSLPLCFFFFLPFSHQSNVTFYFLWQTCGWWDSVVYHILFKTQTIVLSLTMVL